MNKYYDLIFLLYYHIIMEEIPTNPYKIRLYIEELREIPAKSL